MEMEFVRGDQATHTVAIPTASWSAGGKLFFAAKVSFDDDNTDSEAKISGVFDDDNVTDTTINGVAHKLYTCVFPAAATEGIAGEGAGTVELLGEFQFVTSGGVPTTFPAREDDKIKVHVYMDIKRKTTP